jgi:hypothetical protein
MTETLKNELCNYLGQLMYELENEVEESERDKIRPKIKAVKILLDIK